MRVASRCCRRSSGLLPLTGIRMSILYHMQGNILKSRTPTPQASYHTPRKPGGPGRPIGGDISPLGKTSGLPSKAAIYDLALPRHHRTRHL